MDSMEYDEWKNHRLTVKFHQYLRDFRASLMERWAGGLLVGDDNIMAIAKAQMADEIVSFDNDTIANFYGSTKGDV